MSCIKAYVSMRGWDSFKDCVEVSGTKSGFGFDYIENADFIMRIGQVTSNKSGKLIDAIVLFNKLPPKVFQNVPKLFRGVLFIEEPYSGILGTNRMSEWWMRIDESGGFRGESDEFDGPWSMASDMISFVSETFEKCSKLLMEPEETETIK